MYYKELSSASSSSGPSGEKCATGANAAAIAASFAGCVYVKLVIENSDLKVVNQKSQKL